VSFLHWPVLVAVIVVFVALHVLRATTFTWTLACGLAVYTIARFGFVVPIPSSVIFIYMGITTAALAAYVTSSSDRITEFLAPIDSVVNEPRRRPLLALILLALPALAAINAYMGSRVRLEAPGFSRTVHPAPPDSITVHDKPYDIAHGKNPFRELEKSDPEAYRKHVANGRVVYYRNCVFCHGDSLAGNGMFIHGLNPIPTNFADKGTIGMLQESFLFWRISKGGPGLPAEGGPWDSAMPAWEKFLKDEEMWEVILFLYDFTGERPRAEGEATH
jgi:Cytochrome C oxidase, cbb3-type, subunit III